VEAILLGLLYINLTMKKILFIILLCLNIQLTYGTTFNSAGSIYGRDRGVSTSEYRIGYTSQYGGGFSNPKSTFGYPRNTYINPKSTFGKTTYDNYHSNEIYPGNTYDNYQSNYSSGEPSGRGGPRKISFGGYTFWILWGSSHGVPSDASNEDMYNYYDAWEKNNNLTWTEWYNQKYHPVPIGDGLVPLSLLCLGYILYRRRSNFFV